MLTKKKEGPRVMIDMVWGMHREAYVSLQQAIKEDFPKEMISWVNLKEMSKI